MKNLILLLAIFTMGVAQAQVNIFNSKGAAENAFNYPLKGKITEITKKGRISKYIYHLDDRHNASVSLYSNVFASDANIHSFIDDHYTISGVNDLGNSSYMLIYWDEDDTWMTNVSNTDQGALAVSISITMIEMQEGSGRVGHAVGLSRIQLNDKYENKY